MKKVLLVALLLAGCGSGPNDTGISSKLDEALKIEVYATCLYALGPGSTPMSRIGHLRNIEDVAEEICEQHKLGKRTMRDGSGF